MALQRRTKPNIFELKWEKIEPKGEGAGGNLEFHELVGILELL